MTPLFELVLRHVPAPKVEEGPFRLLGNDHGIQFLSRAADHRPHHLGRGKAEPVREGAEP